MSENNPGDLVASDQVVSLDYSLTVDGEIVDSTEGQEPLEYLHGHNNIIPGLESQLEGLSIGDKKTIVVLPADGYGAFDPRLVVNVPRQDIPEDIPVQVGTELQVRNEEGELSYAMITKVEGENVQMDLNHPLAGKELHFEIRIAGLRQPTEEELAHGHVHSHGHHH